MGQCCGTGPEHVVSLPMEQAFWEKISRFGDSMEKYEVCRYPMSEAELPLAMEKYGFHSVSTGFATPDLTPDNPKYSPEQAHAMINALRFCALEALDSALATVPEHTSPEEIELLKALVNQRYDSRIHDYDMGKKYWETNLSVIMMIKGEKKIDNE